MPKLTRREAKDVDDAVWALIRARESLSYVREHAWDGISDVPHGAIAYPPSVVAARETEHDAALARYRSTLAANTILGRSA